MPSVRHTDVTNITVFSGHKFVYNEWWANTDKDQWIKDNDIVVRDASRWQLHPNFSLGYNFGNLTGDGQPFFRPIHDIGLIQLSAPIELSPLHNSICLPVEHSIETDNQYVLAAGYGNLGNKMEGDNYPAQVTYARIIGSNYPTVLVTIDSKGGHCKVSQNQP